MTREHIKAAFAMGIFYIVLTIGCSKDQPIVMDCICESGYGKTCVIYEQTYCADPWGQYDLPDTALLQNLNEYFDSLGVTLYNLGIEEGGIQEICMACSCKSGKRFCAKVKDNDLVTIKQHGFTEN